MNYKQRHKAFNGLLKILFWIGFILSLCVTPPVWAQLPGGGQCEKKIKFTLKLKDPKKGSVSPTQVEICPGEKTSFTASCNRGVQGPVKVTITPDNGSPPITVDIPCFSACGNRRVDPGEGCEPGLKDCPAGQSCQNCRCEILSTPLVGIVSTSATVDMDATVIVNVGDIPPDTSAVCTVTSDDEAKLFFSTKSFNVVQEIRHVEALPLKCYVGGSQSFQVQCNFQGRSSASISSRGHINCQLT